MNSPVETGSALSRQWTTDTTGTAVTAATTAQARINNRVIQNLLSFLDSTKFAEGAGENQSQSHCFFIEQASMRPDSWAAFHELVDCLVLYDEHAISPGGGVGEPSEELSTTLIHALRSFFADSGANPGSGTGIDLLGVGQTVRVAAEKAVIAFVHLHGAQPVNDTDLGSSESTIRPATANATSTAASGRLVRWCECGEHESLRTELLVCLDSTFGIWTSRLSSVHAMLPLELRMVCHACNQVYGPLRLSGVEREVLVPGSKSGEMQSQIITKIDECKNGVKHTVQVEKTSDHGFPPRVSMTSLMPQ